ncbi:MAG: hypothetical protein ACI9XO_002390 [Paraglaciecola sp.]
MKKILKWLFILILLVIVALVGFGIYANESKPVGTPDAAADAMAQKMLAAVDKTAWDSTQIVQWTFRGAHDFLWDKSRNFVKVSWDDNEVLLDTKSVTGKAFKNGTELSGDEANTLVQSAWGYFCNDSFWMNAPFKAFDPGTSRSIVKDDEGREGLMVSYTSGGTTPGDSYLWFLDDTGLPTSYKIWVSIIPVGGLEFTWEDWKTLPTSAKVAQMHNSSLFPIPIDNLKSGDDFGVFELTEDPFLGLK